MLLKTLFVAIMLFVGLTARQVAQQRLARSPDLSPPTADRLRRAFGTEAAIGVIVIGLSGWLMSFTPPKSPENDVAEFAVEEPFVDTQSGVDLVVQLTPARVGGNQLRVARRRAGQRPRQPRRPVHPARRLRPGLGGAADPADRRGRRRLGAGRPPAVGRRAVDDAGQRDDADGHDDVLETFNVATADGEQVTPGIEPTPTAAPVTAPTTTLPIITTPG